MEYSKPLKGHEPSRFSRFQIRHLQEAHPPADRINEASGNSVNTKDKNK